MMRRAKILRNTLPLLLPFFFLFCNKRVNNDTTPPDRISVPAFGSQNTLEIATWNIQQFPKHNQTVKDVAEIIIDLDIDLFAVQEITNPNAFGMLMDSLTEYDGVVAKNTGSFPLWTGIIYRKSLIAISNQQVLFTSDSYNFPRFPYSVYIQANQNNKTFDFTLIVLHLKAEDGDPTSQQRRGIAIDSLENYVNRKLQQSGDPDYIIAGDWNDLLEDPDPENVFLPFLNQAQTYTFLTLPFAGSPTEYSYIGGNFESLIDHIMITATIDTTYNIFTQIIKIDQLFTQYEAEVSDHRPVAARMPVF